MKTNTSSPGIGIQKLRHLAPLQLDCCARKFKDLMLIAEIKQIDSFFLSVPFYFKHLAKPFAASIKSIQKSLFGIFCYSLKHLVNLFNP